MEKTCWNAKTVYISILCFLHFFIFFILDLQPLDYELQSVFNLQIDARNPEPLIKGVEYNESATTFVVIQLVDVDEPPEFEVETVNVNVPENITVGTVIMTAEAKDPEGKTIK